MPQKTARRAPARRSSPSSRKRTAKKKPGQARGPRRPPGRSSRRGHATRSGIGLVVFGLLAVLSVWFDAAGPAGRRHLVAPAAGVRRRRGRCSRWSACTGGSSCCATSRAEDRVRMFIGFIVLVLGRPRARLAPPREPGSSAGTTSLARRGRAHRRAGGPPALARALADRRGRRLRWGSPRSDF